MAEALNEQATAPEKSKPDEQSIDVKLAAAADRNHALAAERRSKGNDLSIAATIGGERFKALRGVVQAFGGSNSAREVIARISPDGSIIPPLTRGQWVVPEGYRDAIVPKRFHGARFENYEPQTKSQGLAHRTVLRWLEKVRAGESVMLALIGSTGTGKSHLAYAAVNALLEEPRRVYARPWYRLADELRFGGKIPGATQHTREGHGVRDQLWAQPIVVLDEVRATASTAFDDTELAKFACHAYDADIPTLITTNVSPLDQVMGPPAASRFTQVIIEGPDWRQS